jgi:1-acyl-sn-glycerol-3-phosphate acyltransferase
MDSLRLVYRVPWLLLHLLFGLPLTLLSQTSLFRSIRLGGRPVSEIVLNWWSSTTCAIFGLQRIVHGEISSRPQLVVANHISWIDIKLLHSVSPMGFVAKAEIQKWPLAGWVASFGDTVFHHRGSHDSANGVATVMAQRLREGGKIAIFPEGGILPGDGVKRFHARMFAAAVDTGSPVQPVMIRYLRDGKHYPAMTFLPGESFIANFFRLLRQRPCQAELCILPPIESAGLQRRDLASAAETAIRAAYNSETSEAADG